MNYNSIYIKKYKSMGYSDEELKLIYVLKIGYNTKGEGQYEFVFSHDEANIDIETWGWDLEPASDNANPPEEEYIDKIVSLKTDLFDLYCLHEAVDRPYMHGYHTIHALAYEIEYQGKNDGFDSYEEIFDDEEAPLLVFHYGVSLKEVKEMFYERKIILKGDEFIESAKTKLI